MIPFFTGLVKALKEQFFPEGIVEGLAWLLHRSPLALRLTTVAALILSAGLGTIVWMDVSETNRIITQAVSSPIESTPQPNSAIEALLLASVLPKTIQQATPAQNDPQPAPEFDSALDAIKVGLVQPSKTASQSTPSQRPENQGKPATPPQTITSSLQLYVANNDSNLIDLSDAILSDRSDGFLFVPGAILPAIPNSNVDDAIGDKNNISLRLDIEASQRVAHAFCSGLQSRFAAAQSSGAFSPGSAVQNVDPRFLQAYLIFRSVVTRLCESSSPPDWQSQSAYYKSKFTPRTLLQTRPYFEPTIHAQSTYSTGPYVDLGGNGVVQTLCRYMPVTSQSNEGKGSQRTDAIICFDFALTFDWKQAIRSELPRFGGTAVEYSCANSQCVRDAAPEPNIPFASRLMSIFYPPVAIETQDEQEMNHRYNDSRKNAQESAFFGGLSFLGRDSGTGMIRFTVPTGGNKVLAVKFDMASYQSWRSVWLSLTAACIAMAAILALFILADYGTKFREQQRAFAAVDSIMSDVPAPYSRLDEDGKFLKVNQAFAELMSYTTAAQAMTELRNYNYEDFLADDESRELYRIIRAERRSGVPYRSYTVRLWTGCKPGVGPIRWVKVHGGDVPAPHPSAKLGQSFGILLPTDAPRPVVLMEPRDSIAPSRNSEPEKGTKSA